MTISITSPVAGLALTGFTAPTYTIVADQAPTVNGKQFAVSALGGTQASVTTSSVGDPFTVTVTRPQTFKLLQAPDPSTGRLPSVPMNSWTFLVRKGVLPLVNQPKKPAMIRTSFEIPAGSDLADPINLKAMFAFYSGLWALTANVQSYYDSVITGTL